MASKQDRFYFENFVSAADCSCKAADYLVSCLSSYSPDDVEHMVGHMHGIEHLGDTKKHEVSEALAKAFVTPVDREDLAMISQNIDEVTDKIEEVIQRIYINDVKTILPEAVEFSKKLSELCTLMKEMLSEFANFKKPAKLKGLILQISNAEEDCDKLYLEACINIKKHCTEVLDVISWRQIYDKLESCADACEHVGDCIDTVVMKNT